MRLIFAWLTLLCALCGADLALAVSVKLAVEESSFRPGAFPIAALRRSCAAIGVRETAKDNPTHRVDIHYTEERAGDYRPAESRGPAVSGTTISYNVTVTRVSDETALGMMSAQFHAGQYVTLFLPKGQVVTEKTLYRYTHRAFLDSPQFRLTCTFISAAQGSTAAYSTLLRWAVVQENGLAALNSLDFSSTNPMLAGAKQIATRTFTERTEFAAATGVYLQAFLESHFRETEFGRAWPNLLVTGDSRRGFRLLGMALKHLTNLDPARAKQLLPSLLSDIDSALSEPGADDEAQQFIQLALDAVHSLSIPCRQVGDTLNWMARRSDRAGQSARALATLMKCGRP